MKYVRLALDQDPEVRHPMHQFVVAHDGYEVSRLLEVSYSQPGTDAGEGFGIQTALFHVTGSPVEPYEAALRETEEVIEYELSRRDDDSFYLYVRGEHTDADDRLVEAFSRQGLVLMMPVEFHADGTMRATVIGPGETVQRAVEALPEAFTVDVRSVGEYDARYFVTGGRLTDRQYEAVDAAVDCGYYEEPRSGSVADVAEVLGCSPGTAAEHLRRAEASVMADVVSERFS
ncbi:Predicted DNA binding protein, contains HTH domain [Halomicrobium zhouii]|uniref:Predicted DNA binding protein, contains HTH domain n=1 Tax=Halomicrobium zhouii TaxID=767519 RepID=A0A1I6L704_9EURY|nr:helix-turn-helix domain-containing protein [Halomicrobium zhouii]SFR99255.1 Predicted DNA binding protein, contains HTH domain [Halomicrobium zhouii]